MRHSADTAPKHPDEDPTMAAPDGALSRGNTVAYSAATVCRPDRPRIHADRDFDGRWLVEHQGHTVPFPRWESALQAALEPRRLCRYGCITPDHRRREAT